LQITEEERLPKVFVNYQSKGRNYHGLERKNWITGKSDDLDLIKEEEQKREEVDDSGDDDISVVYTCT
jgi:hypothetical protein